MWGPAAAPIIWAVIILICAGIYMLVSHIALYFIFRVLLAPIPVNPKRDEDYLDYNLKIPVGHSIATTFIGLFIYLLFPAFFIVLLVLTSDIKVHVYWWFSLLLFPFCLWGLMYSFKAITRSTCRTHPCMIYVLNQRRKETRDKITGCMIAIIILLLIALFLVLFWVSQ